MGKALIALAAFITVAPLHAQTLDMAPEQPAQMATPAKHYFRIANPSQWQASVGVDLSPSLGDSSLGTAVPLIYHLPEDGCAFPPFCEEWSPLTIGTGQLRGLKAFGIGPMVNLAPSIKALLLKGVEAITQPESYQNLRTALAPAEPSATDVTVSLGVRLLVVPSQNYRSGVRMFTGAALRFGK